MTREELFDTMTKLGSTIIEGKRIALENRRDIATMITELKKIKTSVETDVANEIDGTGKPAFSNADKRAVEVTKRLESNVTYTDMEQLRDIRQQAVEDVEISISEARYMFRAYEAYANFKE